MVQFMKSGLSALCAFALVMTVTLTAGATEKVVETGRKKVGTEKVALATSVQAQTLSVTVEKLIAKWAMEKALRKPEEIEVMKDPMEKASAFKSAERALVDTYFEFIGTPGVDEDDPDMWVPSSPGGCNGNDASCKILVKSAYVGASPTRILLTAIPVVAGSPGNQIPNPTAAGNGASQPFVSIHNQP